MEESRKLLRARCDEMGVVLRILFALYAAFVAAAGAAAVWLLFQPAAHFLVEGVQTEAGWMGLGTFRGGWSIEFACGQLSAIAATQPKATYLAAYACGMADRAFVLASLRNVVCLFRRIEHGDTPFRRLACCRVLRIGQLTAASGFVRSALASVVFTLLGIAGSAPFAAAVFWRRLIAGGIAICLSYVFDYGAALQTESDETL